MTRGLTHSLASTLTFVMKTPMMEMPFCYYCKNGQPDYCATCRIKAHEEYYNFYYLDYFSAFYSDYFADLYGGPLESPEEEEGEGEGEGEGQRSS